MSRIPNPFLGGDTQPKHPHTPTPSGPSFLMMTRPPSGSNSYGGRGGRGVPFTPFTPSHRHVLTHTPSDSFIAFSATGSNNSQENIRRGRGGRFSGGGGRGQGSPRMFSPFHPSPQARGGGKWSIGVPFTPTRHSGNRDSFGNQRQHRFSFNGNGSRGGRDLGPISDIPVEKFVSPNMVGDPWAEFDVPATVPAPHTPDTPDTLTRTATLPLPLLDDSEIVIDSDTSVVVENSFEGGGGVSGTEGDSSPVPDTGSDSPYVATSSTSDKDGASDSTGDD